MKSWVKILLGVVAGVSLPLEYFIAVNLMAKGFMIIMAIWLKNLMPLLLSQ